MTESDIVHVLESITPVGQWVRMGTKRPTTYSTRPAWRMDQTLWAPETALRKLMKEGVIEVRTITERYWFSEEQPRDWEHRVLVFVEARLL